jgi:antitoxin VapB
MDQAVKRFWLPFLQSSGISACPSGNRRMWSLSSNRVSLRTQDPLYTLGRTHVATVMDVLPSRVFMNGNSQAVRIPAEFRLSSDRVQIRRTPEGDLIIHPCPTQRGQALLDVLEGFPDDFVAALEQQRSETLPVQERESL